jgi:hypothetical protein
MEHIFKLYGKPYHLYTIEDWKYIFSILKKKDKYNHTEEEFLAAELIDKTAMMKKMDENVSKYGWSTTIDEHDEPLINSCPEDEGCKVIQDFLEDEDVKDHIHSPEDALKDFLDEEIDEIAIIKNQWDLAFKDRERLLTIIRFIDEQSKNAYADLDAVHKTINDLDERYYKYKQKNPQWQ